MLGGGIQCQFCKHILTDEADAFAEEYLVKTANKLLKFKLNRLAYFLGFTLRLTACREWHKKHYEKEIKKKN